PRNELRFMFVRSSGPGGQNVNKVASKALLRWSLNASTALPEPVRVRLAVQFAGQINDRGELFLSSQRYRDQGRNIEDCLQKLREIVLTAASVTKKRKKTRVPKSATEKRLRQKRARSETKQGRRKSTRDE